MKKIKKIVIIILPIVAVLYVVGLYLASPAKNMDAYKKSYTNDTLAPDRGAVKVTFLRVT
jgi:hypothetical protein